MELGHVSLAKDACKSQYGMEEVSFSPLPEFTCFSSSSTTCMKSKINWFAVITRLRRLAGHGIPSLREIACIANALT